MSQDRKSRGRPATFDRIAALDVATHLFWRHGYEGTSIAMLTEGMGVTAPTLYAAFGSKEDLYRAALAHYGSRYQEAATSAPHEDGSLYRMVEHLLRETAVRYARPDKPKGCMIATGSLQCGADNTPVVEATAGARAYGLRAFIAQLDQAKLKGELPPDTDSEALARFYAAVVQGMSVQAIDGADLPRLNAIVDVALAAWPAAANGGRK